MSANIQIIDGFVWSVIDADTAKESFINGDSVFLLYDDSENSHVESLEDFESLDTYVKAGLKLGTESELIADWQEATERNNDKRSFMAWLEDKAENLIEN